MARKKEQAGLSDDGFFGTPMGAATAALFRPKQRIGDHGEVFTPAWPEVRQYRACLYEPAGPMGGGSDIVSTTA